MPVALWFFLSILWCLSGAQNYWDEECPKIEACTICNSQSSCQWCHYAEGDLESGACHYKAPNEPFSGQAFCTNSPPLDRRGPFYSPTCFAKQTSPVHTTAPCKDATCAVGFKCTPLDDGYTCTVDPTFQPCNPNPCSNGQYCRSAGNTRSGYSCHSWDICIPNPCSSATAICKYDAVNAYTCTERNPCDQAGVCPAGSDCVPQYGNAMVPFRCLTGNKCVDDRPCEDGLWCRPTEAFPKYVCEDRRVIGSPCETYNCTTCRTHANECTWCNGAANEATHSCQRKAAGCPGGLDPNLEKPCPEFTIDLEILCASYGCLACRSFPEICQWCNQGDFENECVPFMVRGERRFCRSTNAPDPFKTCKDCSALNNCNGAGDCIDFNKCKCHEGFIAEGTPADPAEPLGCISDPNYIQPGGGANAPVLPGWAWGAGSGGLAFLLFVVLASLVIRTRKQKAHKRKHRDRRHSNASNPYGNELAMTDAYGGGYYGEAGYGGSIAGGGTVAPGVGDAPSFADGKAPTSGWKPPSDFKEAVRKQYGKMPEPPDRNEEETLNVDESVAKGEALYLAVALWNCEADTDDELSFKEGDVIEILDDSNPEWLVGRLGQQVGSLPKSFVERTDSGQGVIAQLGGWNDQWSAQYEGAAYYGEVGAGGGEGSTMYYGEAGGEAAAWGGTVQPGSDQAWGGTVQPGSDQAWGGTVLPGSTQAWGGTVQQGPGSQQAWSGSAAQTGSNWGGTVLQTPGYSYGNQGY